MSETVVTMPANFAVPIPKSVREQLRWTAGQRFALIPKAGGLLMMPVPTFDDMRGFMRGASNEGYRDREDRDERY